MFSFVFSLANFLNFLILIFFWCFLCSAQQFKLMIFHYKMIDLFIYGKKFFSQIHFVSLEEINLWNREKKTSKIVSWSCTLGIIIFLDSVSLWCIPNEIVTSYGRIEDWWAAGWLAAGVPVECTWIVTLFIIYWASDWLNRPFFILHINFTIFSILSFYFLFEVRHPSSSFVCSCVCVCLPGVQCVCQQW